jgi:hypothetical protein
VVAADLTDPRDLERLVRIAEGLQITTPGDFAVDFEPSGFEDRSKLCRKCKEEVTHAVNKLLLSTETAAGLPAVS